MLPFSISTIAIEVSPVIFCKLATRAFNFGKSTLEAVPRIEKETFSSSLSVCF
jgi:hypothetical protein